MVFRNNVSHARYNEARMLLTTIKNALRGTAALVHTVAGNTSTPEVMEKYKFECKEITKGLQVGSAAGFIVRACSTSVWHGAETSADLSRGWPSSGAGEACNHVLHCVPVSPAACREQVLFTTIVEDVRDSRSVEKARTAPPAPSASLRSVIMRIIASRRYNDSSRFHSYPTQVRPVLAALEVSQLLHDFHQRPDGSKEFHAIQISVLAQRMLHDDGMRVRVCVCVCVRACVYAPIFVSFVPLCPPCFRAHVLRRRCTCA